MEFFCDLRLSEVLGENLIGNRYLQSLESGKGGIEHWSECEMRDMIVWIWEFAMREKEDWREMVELRQMKRFECEKWWKLCIYFYFLYVCDLCRNAKILINVKLSCKISFTISTKHTIFTPKFPVNIFNQI